MGTQNFFLSHARNKTKKTPLSKPTEVCTFSHVSHSLCNRRSEVAYKISDMLNVEYNSLKEPFR